MKPRAILEQVVSEQLVDANDEPIEVTLLPGLDDAGVRRLASALGAPLPADIEELVRFARGFEFRPVDDAVAFDSGFSFGMETILPRASPLCGDGYGNSWVVEVQRTGAWGPVLFANHDPPVLVVQASDMASFFEQVFAKGRKLPSALDDVHDDASIRIWLDNPGGRPAGELRGSEDPTLRDFAASLKDDDRVFDLREQVVGSGFAWGRHGPSAPLRRYRDALLFAVVTPASRPGFFGRLFGR